MINCPRCQAPVEDESHFCDHCGKLLLSEARAPRRSARTYHNLVRVVALTAFIFSLLIWAYVVVIQVTYPDWMDTTFSHINFFPFNWRVGDVGLTAFVVAAAGFLIWQIELNMKDKDT